MKTIYQDDLVTAQGVKTLGRRNAKTTTTERSWKNTSNMKNDTNRGRSRRMWMPEREEMEMQRKQQANVRAN